MTPRLSFLKRFHKLGFNPEKQPVVAVEALPKLPAWALQRRFIQQAFAEPSGWPVEACFKASFVESFDEVVDAVPSAVYLGLLERSTGLSMLFTRRTLHLPDHPGQISFPGGRIEAHDTNAMDAAVRETYEEVGIAPQFIEPLGEHPILVTSTGFAIRPVIGLIHEGYTIKPCLHEVEEVFEVPLVELLDPANHALHKLSLPEGKTRYYYSVQWQEYFIWGATAVLIRNLYHFLQAAYTQKTVAQS